MTLAQGHILKVKVAVYSHQNSLSGPELLTVVLELNDISHSGIPWPKDVLDFESRSYI